MIIVLFCSANYFPHTRHNLDYLDGHVMGPYVYIQQIYFMPYTVS